CHRYLVAYVYIHSIHLRCIRRFPRLPLLSGRVVTADLARHPFADPEPSLAVGPHATRALPRRRRLDDSGLSAFCIDVRQMTAGERDVVDLALRRGGDSIRSAPLRRFDHSHLAALGIHAPVVT